MGFAHSGLWGGAWVVGIWGVIGSVGGLGGLLNRVKKFIL